MERALKLFLKVGNIGTCRRLSLRTMARAHCIVSHVKRLSKRVRLYEPLDPPAGVDAGLPARAVVGQGVA